MKKFEVYEDNGGGLHLVTFGADGAPDYIHSGYEYVNGQLAQDLEALRNGGDPIADGWDGCEDSAPLADLYNEICGFGCDLIADNDGVYRDRMGASANRSFCK